jgi:Oxidative-stress-responsive kinase 1 C terminal.
VYEVKLNKAYTCHGGELKLSSIMFHIHRPGVKDLLVHEFFAEDLGLRLEIISREEAVVSAASKVEFRLRVLDPKKRSNKHKENEAIQFEFDIQADNAEEVASEMASIIFEHSFVVLHDALWYH